ncbi:MAG: BTAD domain-containing putative transcriptional regulator [Candidatus Promineifilaceae bacterium]|nr:BTAD domain-containing putative transcriptional regulator [Candidatus Promineifilaceae bacterium]
MPKLALTLLGRFQAEYDNQPLTGFRTNKVQALLIYLVTESQPHLRESMMDLLWPDMPLDAARHNLRQILYYLRGAIPEVEAIKEAETEQVPLLLTDRRTIQLNPEAQITADIDQFQALQARCQEHRHADPLQCAACRQDLEDAAALYRGDFLADFFLPDSAPFEAWASARRTAFQRLYLDVLQKLGRIYLAHDLYKAAAEAARKQIAADDLRESAQRQLLEVLARSGQRNEALAHYDALRRRLWAELGVAPEKATVALVERIERGDLDQSTAVEAAGTAIAAAFGDEMKPTAPRFLVEDAVSEPVTTTFVTREHELARLQTALDGACDGRGQIIFITGSAGRGKTMLMQEFARRAAAADPDLVVVTGYCAAITGVGDPYLPFREALAALTGDVEARWSAGLISRQQAQQLWELMPVSLPALLKYGPDLVNSLLSAQALRERAAAWAAMNGSWIEELEAIRGKKQSTGVDQQRIFAEYAAVLKAIAAQRPLLFIIEDLHWVDTASSALLFYLSREISDQKILLAGTYRPEEVTLNRAGKAAAGHGQQHPLAGIFSELKRQHGDIWLDLGQRDGRAGRHFVDAYLDTLPNQLGESFRAALFRQTEGHPLFTVELIRALQVRGDLREDENGRWVAGESIDWTALPLKVEGVIERRIEPLEEDLHSILSAAAVEGEIFTAEVIAHVLGLDQRRLVQQLGQELDKKHLLVGAHALEWLRPARQRISLYRFRHQLFQQYLYQRLDEVERAYLHEAVADALEQLYAGHTGQVAGQLAHHFQVAGLIPQAIDYYRQAGEAAADVHAYNEAVAHYSRALELAEIGALSSADLAHLHTRLGGLLLVTRGDWAPEVGQAFGRAHELYQQNGESRQHFAALRGLAMYYRMRGELAEGRPYAEELISLARRLDDPLLIVEASFALGSLLYFAGEHAPAQENLERGIRNYQPEKHQTLSDDQDPGVALLSYSAHNLWLLGYPDRALRHANEAVALADELDHPYSKAMALIWSCWTHIFRWETELVLQRSAEAIRLSVKHDFPLFAAVGTVQHGWAIARQGQNAAGMAKMEQGLGAAAQAVGSESPPATLLIHFAGAYGDDWDPDQGLRILDEALAQVSENGLRLLEPELYRHQGELLLKRDGPGAEIEALLLRAVELARKQQVKSLELRAVMSLGRLWRSQGKTKEVQRMLSEVYGWFSEGFETADLTSAVNIML